MFRTDVCSLQKGTQCVEVTEVTAAWDWGSAFAHHLLRCGVHRPSQWTPKNSWPCGRVGHLVGSNAQCLSRPLSNALSLCYHSFRLAKTFVPGCTASFLQAARASREAAVWCACLGTYTLGMQTAAECARICCCHEMPLHQRWQQARAGGSACCIDCDSCGKHCICGAAHCQRLRHTGMGSRPSSTGVVTDAQLLPTKLQAH